MRMCIHFDDNTYCIYTGVPIIVLWPVNQLFQYTQNLQYMGKECEANTMQHNYFTMQTLLCSYTLNASYNSRMLMVNITMEVQSNVLLAHNPS